MSIELNKNRGLGRGLDSLLPRPSATATPNPTPNSPSASGNAPNGLVNMPIRLIDPNPNQPRQVFDPQALQELAASIKANGIVQPIIVRRRQERFEIVAGERRWRAAQVADLTEVPVVVQDVADNKLLELALIENIQRSDLNPMETAAAFDRLTRELEISHEELGRRTGKDRATITNFIRLLKLPKDLQGSVAEGKLTMGHAKALLALTFAEQQLDTARKVMQLGMSVRATEKMVQNILEPKEESKEKEEEKIDPNVRAAQDELRNFLGTKVQIVATSEKRGFIQIEYYSQDDLDRIYNLILGEK
jgi:ParB family transcriptional regulator, chromosome partitioning protein